MPMKTRHLFLEDRFSVRTRSCRSWISFVLSIIFASVLQCLCSGFLISSYWDCIRWINALKASFNFSTPGWLKEINLCKGICDMCLAISFHFNYYSCDSYCIWVGLFYLKTCIWEGLFPCKNVRPRTVLNPRQLVCIPFRCPTLWPLRQNKPI